jgi:hypothetical protein
MLGPVQSLARYLIIWQSLQQDVTSNPITKQCRRGSKNALNRPAIDGG